MTALHRTRLIVLTIIALLFGTKEAMAQTAPAPAAPSPLEPLLKLNQAFATNDPKRFAEIHAPGTTDETAFDSAEQTLLTARGQFFAVYRAKLDPQNNSHMLAAFTDSKAIPEERLRAAVVKRLDDHTADVEIPNELTYRIALVNGQWRIQSGASIGSMYPADPAMALRALTQKLHDRASAFELTTQEINAGTLATPADVSKAVGDRLQKIDAALHSALPPPAFVVLANASINNTEHSDPKFKAGVDPDVKHFDEPSMLLLSTSAGPAADGHTFRIVDATPYLGKRVRISAYLKCDGVGNGAGIGMVAVEKSGKWGAFDTPSNQLVGDVTTNSRLITGTSDWKKVQCVADIPEETQIFGFGLQMFGSGKTWLDGARIEIVGKDVPTTDDQNLHLYSAYSPKYSIAIDRTTKRDGHPVICITPHTPPRGAHSWFGLTDRHPDSLLGHPVRLSAWMKCEGKCTAHLSLVAALHGQPDTEIDVDAGKPGFPLSTQWQHYEVTGNVPADAQCLTEGDFLWGNGKVWIDEFKIENLDTPPQGL
jgi:hypothetical protein